MALVNERPGRDDVWLVNLDPTVGSEIRKTRPCVVVSPDEMNQHLRTVILAPMTTVQRSYPTRISLSFQGKRGQIALDQIRSVDRSRMIKKLGSVPQKTGQAVSVLLTEMFGRI